MCFFFFSSYRQCKTKVAAHSRICTSFWWVLHVFIWDSSYIFLLTYTGFDLCFVLQGQICLLLQVISWLPTFAFQSPIMERTSFLGVSSRRSCRSGHRLGLLWYWMVCLGNEQRSYCCFLDCIKVLHFGLFCWLWYYSISSKGLLPTVVDIMVIWVKFTHSNPF